MPRRHEPRLNGVFAAELRGGALQALLLALYPRFARPAAFEIVADVEAQAAQAFSFELDRVAVLKRIESAVVGARGQDVTGIQRMDRRDPFDAPRNLVGHVVGTKTLHEHAVGPQ